MKLRAFGLTDVGRRRESNEDDFLLDPAHGLFAVADGMGGHAAGEVASRMAIDTLREVVRREDARERHLGVEETADWLRDAVVEANRRICDSIQTHEEQRGMGTTLVALIHAGGEAVVGHVGDSRLYRLRGDGLTRMTSDHSWVNEQVKLGLMNDDAAQRHPMRNIVTRALGSRPDVAVDLTSLDIELSDVFLLCSDGLNTMLSDAQIQAVLSAHRREPEAACRELIREANRHGGEDNVTVVVACVTETA